jgi:hypothetical protein
MTDSQPQIDGNAPCICGSGATYDCCCAYSAGFWGDVTRDRVSGPWNLADIDALNAYLAKLEGPANLVHFDCAARSVVIRVGGSVGGPYDDGEILLRFVGMQVMHLPVALVTPLRLAEAPKGELAALLPDPDYRASGALRYFRILDCRQNPFYVYAAGLEGKLLPIFWEPPA